MQVTDRGFPVDDATDRDINSCKADLLFVSCYRTGDLMVLHETESSLQLNL